MKKFAQRIANGLMVVAILVGISAFVMVQNKVTAQVQTQELTPKTYVDSTGTNTIGFNTSAGMELRAGSTVYTGATTNVPFLLGTGITNRLVIVRGVVTGITVF